MSAWAGEPMLDLDLEATGVDPDNDRIATACAAIVREGVVTCQRDWMIAIDVEGARRPDRRPRLGRGGVMGHQQCTKPHPPEQPVPAHCSGCAGPWPCRGWLLDQHEHLAHELIDAESRALLAEAERDELAAAVSLLDEELADLRPYTVAEASDGHH